jgi:hemoglobin-like flavoprotein
LGVLFYARLFEVDPGLRALFKTDLQDQGHTLMAMLRLCIDTLDDPAELAYGLRSLGAKHVAYGAKTEDYGTVCDALVWTMREGLGEKWNEETERALSAVFELFTSEMLRGTRNV